MQLVNSLTGQLATPDEYDAGARRAIEIIQSPYSSPEQVAWAMEFPEAMNALVFWQSHRQAVDTARAVAGLR